jgi:hypothetical protein
MSDSAVASVAAEGGDLTVVERRIVDAVLAAGAARGARALAARAARVSERSLRRALALPRVQAALGREARRLLRDASVTLAGGAADAAKALVEMADGTAEPHWGRLAAARAVLELGTSLADFSDLEDRLRALEMEQTPGAGGRH